MDSPLGKGWLESQLSERFGVECQLGSIGMVPGAWLWANDIELKSLGRIERVSLNPSWLQVLRGHLVIDELVIQKPVLDLNPEDLRELTASWQQVDFVEEEKQAPRVDKEVPKQTADAEQTGSTPQAQPGKPDAPLGKKESRKVEARRWVRVKSGEIVLRSAKDGDVWGRFKGIGLDLPLDGKGATGRIGFDGLELGKQLYLEGGEWQVRHQRNLWAGVVVYENAQLGRVQSLWQLQHVSALPFAVNLAFQPPSHLQLGGIQLSGESFLRGSVSGWLTSPVTWRGFLGAGGVKFSARREGGMHLWFDELAADIFYQGGNLFMNRLWAQGDQGAVLGLGAGGLGSGYVRLRFVVAPNFRQAGDHLLARFSKSWRFAQLGTPDRYFFDLDCLWSKGEITLTAAGEEQGLPIHSALEVLLGDESLEQVKSFETNELNAAPEAPQNRASKL